MEKQQPPCLSEARALDFVIAFPFLFINHSSVCGFLVRIKGKKSDNSILLLDQASFQFLWFYMDPWKTTGWEETVHLIS